METKQYVNPFEEVHQKVQAYKDRARKIREGDTELRERNTRQTATADDAKIANAKKVETSV